VKVLVVFSDAGWRFSSRLWKKLREESPQTSAGTSANGGRGSSVEIQIGSRPAPASSNMKCAGSSVWLPYLILPSTFYNLLEQSVMFAF
jgi:hypothetical protein